MNSKTAFGRVLAMIGIIGALLLVLRPIPRAKARAQRISAVNNVSVVSLTLTNTNALPTARPSSAK